jgi:tRNA A-37 threonylcarbamoyl transferase component Bud32
MSDDNAKLKDAFKASDSDGDGFLSFDEFFALLKSGDENFPEDEAQTLFAAADKDGSGTVDFMEFVDYIFDNEDFHEFMEWKEASIEEAEEEEAKKIVMGKSLQVRNSASHAVRENGGDWAKLTWKQRVKVVRAQEEQGAIPEDMHAQTTEVTYGHAETVDTAEFARERKTVQPVSIAHAKTTMEMHEPEDPAPASKATRRQSAPLTAAPNPIATKTQQELVDYSIHKYDLNFAGRDPEATQTLIQFKEGLKTAGGPEEIVNIQKYLAKGTAGWVFMAEKKSNGSRVAMKLIRMTQALSGVKEWYVSKVLRKAGVQNVVYTDEMVCVLARAEAPAIVEEQLRDAGPVPFYMCMLQDFMPGGSLEDLAEKNKLPPRMMFAALEDVACTLSHMHEKNVHHKDVKPENVLVEWADGKMVAAKMCDFGSAEFGNATAGRADDTRRFGVTLFSLATGEGWTKNRLIREKHDALVQRLRKFVESSTLEAMRALPDVLREILSGRMKMSQVAEVMAELKESCKA